MRRRVRVLITADTTSDVVVSPAAGLRCATSASGVTYPLPTIAGREALADQRRRRPTPCVGYLDRRRGTAASPAAGRRWSATAQFHADDPLTLWTPSGAARLPRRAAVRAPERAARPARDTVNVLSMDDYVRGVIPAEMPASWHPEAVKAQAVAARTYATWSRNQNPTATTRSATPPPARCTAASAPRTRAATPPSPRRRGRS